MLAPVASPLPSTVARKANACPDVRLLLHKGRRVSLGNTLPPSERRPEKFLLRLITRTLATPGRGARLAISVPKRLEKRAVSRNRIKRWVREAFRQHPIKTHPVDLLVSLTTRIGEVNRAVSAEARNEIVVLLDRALVLGQRT